jgi:hypothetical protein
MSETLRRVLAAEFDRGGVRRDGFLLDEEQDQHFDSDGQLFQWAWSTSLRVRGKNAFVLELRGIVPTPTRPKILPLITSKGGEYEPALRSSSVRLSVLLTTQDVSFLRELAQAIGGDPPPRIVRRSPPYDDCGMLVALALRRLADTLERESEALEREGRPIPDAGQLRLL